MLPGFGSRRLLCLVAVISAGACSTLVGADFDGLSPASEGSGGSSMAGSAGKDKTGGSKADGGTSTTGGSRGEGGEGGVSIAGSTSGGGGSGTEGGTGGDTGTSGAANGGAGGSEPTDPLEGVFLNELKGQGPNYDFVELFNTGEASVDLSGCYVADDSANRVAFPLGASIAAGGFVLVRLSQPIASGEVTTCDGFSPCYDGTWGISSAGEAIFFRSATNKVLDALAYPAQNSPSGVLDGQSFGRHPDGAETFGAVTISPGNPNSPAPL